MRIIFLVFICSLFLFPQAGQTSAPSDNDQTALETSYIELAQLYKKKKNYLAALNHYFKALEHSTQKNQSGYIYLDIADIFRVMNRQQLAAKYLKRALDYTIKHKDLCLKIQVLNTYSRLAYEEEDYTNALKYIDLSLKTEKELKKYVCSTDSLYHKALILEKTGGKPTEIMKRLKAAVEKGLKEKQYQILLPVMNAYIRQLIDEGELVEAGLYLDKIDDLYAPYHPHFFFYYFLRAIFFEKMGQLEEALTYYRRTTRALGSYFAELKEQQHHAFEEQTTRIYSTIISFYLDLFKRTKSKEYLYKALYFSEAKNAYTHECITLKGKKYIHLSREKKKLENEYLAFHKRFVQLQKQDSRSQQEARYEQKLATLKNQNEELKEFLLEIPIAFKPHTFADLDIPRIQQKLKPHQLIIKYTLLNRDVYAFYVEPRATWYRKLAISTPELVRMVQQLTEPLDDFTRGSVDYLRIHYDLQLAHRLYNILLKDILKTRKHKQELFIIPDRQLFKLPFEALVTGFNQNDLDPDTVFSEYTSADYLIRDYAVSYFLSLFHLQKSMAPSGRRRYAISAFGCPSIRKTKTGKQLFNPLPASREEILDIAAIFGKRQSRIFLANRFNKKNFEIFAPRSRLVHIATHFIANRQYPWYSALLFSPLKRNISFDYCHAHEIFQLKLDADLVVLSACESSEKNLLGLQGLRGMTAAFRNAGARSMIVSMWPVDEHSCQLIPFFYREYREGKPIAAALRAAKLQLMTNAVRFDNGLKISFAHPFLWANYILYNFNY